MIQNTEIPYKYGGGPGIPNLNYQDMYFYATGGVPNNPGFNSLPEKVQKMIIANMKRLGGSHMGYYQGDEGASTIMPDEYGMYGDDGMDMGTSYMESRNPMYVPPTMYYDAPAQAQPAAVVAAQPAASQIALKQYQGPSVVDFLNAQGVSSDYATRKEIAKALGISNYRGTANQNTQLIQAIVNNPNILGNVSAPTKSSRKGKKNTFAYVDPNTGIGYTQKQVDKDNAYWASVADEALKKYAAAKNIPYADTQNQPITSLKETLIGQALSSQGNYEASPEDKNKTPDWVWKTLATTAGVGGMSLLVNQLGESWVKNNAKLLVDLQKAGMSPQDIVNEAKKFGRNPQTMQQLLNRGMGYKDAQQALKGVKFQKPPTNMSAADISADAGKRLKDLYEAGKAANYKKAERLAMVMRDNGFRDPELMAKINKLVPNPAERMKLLKGVKFAPAANAAKASKGLKALKTLGRISRFFDEGGSYNPYMPMYQGDQGSSEFDPTLFRTPQWYDVESTPGYGGAALELLDPTGVSNYDDMLRAWDDPETGWFGKTMATVGSLPVMGAIGKGYKLSKLLKPSGLFSKAKPFPGRKIVNAAQYAADYASGAAPLRVIHSLPFPSALTAGAARAVGSKAGPKTAAAINVIGDITRGERISRMPKEYREIQGRKEVSKILQEEAETIKLKTPDGRVRTVLVGSPEFNELYENGLIDENGYDKKTGTYKLKYKKRGGSINNGATYSGGVFYPDGGTFVPVYGDMAYGALPEYGMGQGYRSGGSIRAGQEMYVTPEEMEALRQQGYDFDIM